MVLALDGVSIEGDSKSSLPFLLTGGVDSDSDSEDWESFSETSADSGLVME